MNILGINAYHADASAVLVRDGRLVAAVEEERIRRVKHVAGFPREAIRACLRIGGLAGSDIDHVAVSRNPRAHLWRKAWAAATRRPGARLIRDRAANYRQLGALPGALAEALGLSRRDRPPRLHGVEHHPAHLASAFFVSPFETAAVCALDGFGDFVSTSWAAGRGRTCEVLSRTYYPHSLGMLYLAITQYLGFRRYGDEFKVMGLASYGEPDFAGPLGQLMALGREGGCALDLSYFVHAGAGASMTWDEGEPRLGMVFSPKLEALLGPARREDEALTDRHRAIAASLQSVFEAGFYHVLNAVHARVGLPRLCLAGGCAMNSVANGRIRERTPFEDVFIQPAAADSGTALGGAFHVWHHVLQRPRTFEMRHGAWGPAFDADAVRAAVAARQGELRAGQCMVEPCADEAALCAWTARHVARGRIVGWFQGPMEWGARALGHRSLLADPRRADMREILNARIKLREPFRPFAASVVEDARARFVEGAAPDPFMMQVRPVRADMRDVIPAVTHVDGSCRIHTVSRDTQPRYWSLLRALERETGLPLVLNTSFNENEPIVCEPAEALDLFLRTQLDALVLGELIIAKPGVDDRGKGA